MKKIILLAALFAGVSVAHAAALQCKCRAGDETTVIFDENGNVRIKCSSGKAASCSVTEEP